MAIEQINLPDGTVIKVDEWVQWPVYSTFEQDKTRAVNVRLFSYVVGARVPSSGTVGRRSANLADTNWQARGRVNNDEAFIWYSATYELFALENNEPYENQPPDLQATSPIFMGTNLRLLQQYVLMEIIIGADISKPQAKAPLEYYGQGIGAVAFGSGDALTISQGAATRLELNYGTGGQVSPRNQRQWALPIYAHSDRVLKVKLRSPEGPVVGLDQDFRMRVTIDGIKRRPIA